MTLAAALLCLCTGASAATKLTEYALIAHGERVALSSGTGYLYSVKGVLMIPVEAACDALGVPYVVDEARKNIRMSPASGADVRLRVGARAMRVDGKPVALRAKTAHQGDRLITADSRVLKALGFVGAHMKPGAGLKKLGYPSGALVVANPGESLALPPVAQTGEGVALPSALKAAAKLSDQIVAIRYKGTRSADMALYEKIGGAWQRTIEEVAYVGSAGIGKTKEGDKKTPTGTFNLTTPFGIKADPGTKMGGYLKVNKNHYWSGQNGQYYNQLVDVSVIRYAPNAKDEHLIDYGAVYNYCLFIDYNQGGEKDKGSAIFLHCQGKNNYTGGCVAVPERVMIRLLEMLESGAKIVIYQ